jgi:hypothetical protein
VTVRTKLAAFTLVLGASFAGGAALGAAIGPDRSGPPEQPSSPVHDGAVHEGHPGG